MGQLDSELMKLGSLDRESYLHENQRMGEEVWRYGGVPTVGDIASYMKTGMESNSMKAIFDFFENRDSFIAMAEKADQDYTEEESVEFIRSVMSSNNTDISKAGYFYKLLMASADDFIVTSDDCGCEGESYDVNSITEDEYCYRVRMNWCDELNRFLDMDFGQFTKAAEGLDVIHVRSPLHCRCFKDGADRSPRGVCRKCAGALPHGAVNLGAFTTLMVTEHATQSALNSMNKGRKMDVNDALAAAYSGPDVRDGVSDADTMMSHIFKWIDNVVDQLAGKKVGSRFYEIALMSRIRFEDRKMADGNIVRMPFVASINSSIRYSGNLFGSYIFTPGNRDLARLINGASNGKTLDDHSLKLQIALNVYDGRMVE